MVDDEMAGRGESSRVVRYCGARRTNEARTNVRWNQSQFQHSREQTARGTKSKIHSTVQNSRRLTLS